MASGSWTRKDVMEDEKASATGSSGPDTEVEGIFLLNYVLIPVETSA
jgi:hypothetical protein